VRPQLPDQVATAMATTPTRTAARGPNVRRIDLAYAGFIFLASTLASR
jgi:hypothetical protein